MIPIDKMGTAKIPEQYVPNKLLSEYNAYVGKSDNNSADFMEIPANVVNDLPF